MDKSERKTAVSAYKERKVPAGIFAVRCAPSGECWVGRSPDLSKIQNRLWFSLRQGNSPHASLNAAWSAHGADAFSFEVIEELADTDSAYVRDSALKERHAHWLSALDATAI
jgi:hypothetical protein